MAFSPSILNQLSGNPASNEGMGLNLMGTQQGSPQNGLPQGNMPMPQNGMAGMAQNNMAMPQNNMTSMSQNIMSQSPLNIMRSNANPNGLPGAQTNPWNAFAEGGQVDPMGAPQQDMSGLDGLDAAIYTGANGGGSDVDSRIEGALANIEGEVTAIFERNMENPKAIADELLQMVTAKIKEVVTPTEMAFLQSPEGQALLAEHIKTMMAELGAGAGAEGSPAPQQAPQAPVDSWS